MSIKYYHSGGTVDGLLPSVSKDNPSAKNVE